MLTRLMTTEAAVSPLPITHTFLASWLSLRASQ